MARATRKERAAEAEPETFDVDETVAVATPAPTPLADDSAPAGYRTTQWADQDNFECERCPYATLDRERIQRHVARAH